MGRLRFSTIVLAMVWTLALLGAVGRFVYPWGGWDVLTGVASFSFAVGLILALGLAKPAIEELPAPGIFSAPIPGFWVRTLLLTLGMGLTFILGLMIGTGFSLMLVCGLVGLGLTLAWLKALVSKTIVVGLVVGLIAALGTVFLGNGDLVWAAVYLFTIPPAFTAGATLMERTQLGQVRLLEGKLGPVLKGFLTGCLLGLPATFINLLGNMQGQDTFIRHWWQPSFAIVPALAEETWALLFLVTFVYAVLRPVARRHPRRAIVVAILTSILAFSFAHAGLNPLVMVIDGLFFSTPYTLLLIKKDFEHAVGYHFMTDFLRYVAAFIALA